MTRTYPAAGPVRYTIVPGTTRGRYAIATHSITGRPGCYAAPIRYAIIDTKTSRRVEYQPHMLAALAARDERNRDRPP